MLSAKPTLKLKLKLLALACSPLFLIALTIQADISMAEVESETTSALGGPSQLDFDELTRGSDTSWTPTGSSPVKASPDATVLSLVQELRQAGNPVPSLDYVDWETAYQKFQSRGIAARERIKITSPESLRSFYSDWFHRSPNVMLRKIGPRLNAMNTAEQRRVMDFFKELDEKTKHRQAPPDPVLSESLYEIKNTERLEGRATVSLIVTHDRKSRTENVNLVEKNGLWFLDSIYLVKDPFGAEYR